MELQEMIKTRGEQRFAAITYSQLALWTGLKLSSIQSYGAKGRIPKDDMLKVLQWVARQCRERHRPGPWQTRLSQRDSFSRELGFWCYQDYLKSDLWQEIRSRILPAQCRKCGDEANQVHHHWYTRENMSGKDLKYLVPLCAPCHLPCHAKREGDEGYYGYDGDERLPIAEELPPITASKDSTKPSDFTIDWIGDGKALPRPASGGYNPLTGDFE